MILKRHIIQEWDDGVKDESESIWKETGTAYFRVHYILRFDRLNADIVGSNSV